MITDKDREDEEAVHDIWEKYENGYCSDAMLILRGVRKDSADQARKEAAERVCEDCRMRGNIDCDIVDSCEVRAAILSDSPVNENLTTDSEKKLGIAVKAIVEAENYIKEDIENGFEPMPPEGHPYWFVVGVLEDALKEIQG